MLSFKVKNMSESMVKQHQKVSMEHQGIHEEVLVAIWLGIPHLLWLAIWIVLALRLLVNKLAMHGGGWPYL